MVRRRVASVRHRDSSFCDRGSSAGHVLGAHRRVAGHRLMRPTLTNPVLYLFGD